MSLTNDMLKNLEKNNRINYQHASIFDGLTSAASNKFYYVIYALVATFLLFLCVEFFYYATHHTKQFVTTTPTAVFKTESLSDFIKQRQAVETATTTAAVPLKTPADNALTPVKVGYPVGSTTQPMVKTESAPVVPTLDALYQDALSALEKNDVADAVEKLGDILNRNPEYMHARITLATIYLEQNDTKTALNILNEGVQLQPHNVDLTLLLARTLASQGHSHQALQTLNNIADVDANDPLYLELLAEINQSLGNDDKAITLYRNLLTQDASNARWLVGLGISLEHNHQVPEALDAYEKANASAQLSPELQAFVEKRIHQLEQ